MMEALRAHRWEGILVIVANALLAPVLLHRLRGGRVATVPVPATTSTFAVWCGFGVVVTADNRDAVGWIGCGDACSRHPVATGSTLVSRLALALVAVLSVLATVAGRGRTSRRRGHRTDRSAW